MYNISSTATNGCSYMYNAVLFNSHLHPRYGGVIPSLQACYSRHNPVFLDQVYHFKIQIGLRIAVLMWKHLQRYQLKGLPGLWCQDQTSETCMAWSCIADANQQPRKTCPKLAVVRKTFVPSRSDISIPRCKFELVPIILQRSTTAWRCHHFWMTPQCPWISQYTAFRADGQHWTICIWLKTDSVWKSLPSLLGNLTLASLVTRQQFTCLWSLHLEFRFFEPNRLNRMDLSLAPKEKMFSG